MGSPMGPARPRMGCWFRPVAGPHQGAEPRPGWVPPAILHWMRGSEFTCEAHGPSLGSTLSRRVGCLSVY